MKARRWLKALAEIFIPPPLVIIPISSLASFAPHAARRMSMTHSARTGYAEFTSSGLQVHRNGQPFALGLTEEIAWALAQVLNGEVLMDIPEADADRVQSILWP